MEASFFSILIFLLSRSLPSSLSVPALTWCARALSFFLFSLLSSARNTRISALLPASGRPSPKLSRRKEQADKRSLSLQHLRDRPIDLRAFFSRSPSRPSPPPPPLSLHALSLHKQTPTACSAPSSRPWPPLRAPPSLPRARGWRRRRRQSSSLADSRPLCLRRLAPRSRAAPPLAPCPPRSARTPLTLPW